MENEKKIQISLFVDKELNNKFVTLCKRDERTRQSMLRYLMAREIKNDGN